LSKYPQARVIAFEPIPKNFDLLEKHRRLNPTKRLVTVNRAVGGTTGKMVLLHDERDSFTTSASIFDRGIGSDPLEVPCVSLADLLKEYRLDRVDLLKMDCEGSEYDILYGCPTRIFKFLHAIVLECHACSGENRNPEALGRFLESRGYATRHGGRGVLWAWRER
jgi:FkbM family methyltransferase